MRKVIAFLAMSLDGYIADADNHIDWLTTFPTPAGEDFGYAKLLEEVDTLVMGRKTYDFIVQQGEPWPYLGKKTWVISRQAECPMHTRDTIKGDFSNPLFLDDIQRPQGGAIWLVGGGEVIKYFIEQQWITTWRLVILPLTLGKGFPLFLPTEQSASWTLEKVRSFENGMVLLHYIKASSSHLLK
jgi:dihydrofolate reductase